MMLQDTFCAQRKKIMNLFINFLSSVSVSAVCSHDTRMSAPVSAAPRACVVIIEHALIDKEEKKLLKKSLFSFFCMQKVFCSS